MNNNLEEIRNNDLFKPFLRDNFDVKSSALVQGATINEQITKISNGIEILNKELQNLISEKFEDLLAQATKLETLEDILQTIHAKVQILLANLDKLRLKLVNPYNDISHQLVRLNRLQVTCDLLRRVIRVIHLSKRLQQSQINENEPNTLTREITKSAQYINEIEFLLSEDAALKDIEVIQNDCAAMRVTKEQIIRIANNMLISGLQKQDPTQTGAALQTFYSLRMLNQNVRQIMETKQEYILKSVRDALDLNVLVSNRQSSGPGRVAIPMTINQNASFRNALWSNIDSLLEKVYITFSQINMLYKLLKKRRDSMTHVLFIDDVENSDGINEFWSFAVKTLSEEMCKAVNDSALLKQVLEGEFPKLLSLFSELWKRINRDDKDIPAEKLLRSSMQPFESAYLSRSLSMLFDSVNKVFADAKETVMTSSLTGSFHVSMSAAPSIEDVDVIIKTISNELSASNFDSSLSKSVAKNVCKTINLFLVKCEQLTSVEGDATQVIGPLTSGQLLNATILQRLKTFHDNIDNLLTSASYPFEVVVSIRDTLKSIDDLMQNIINPLINSVTDAIEAIILTMHSEDYSNVNPTGDAQCSLYMRELQGFIVRVSNDYFSEFPDCKVVQNCIYKVADRTIDLFLRHVSLIRPISKHGKMKIATDFAQLEMAVGPLCQRIGDLGNSYDILRAFKQLLFEEASAISELPVIGDLIPYSLILQFLISSFGPPELKSPHANLNWSFSRYTKWLDEHTKETDRLELIKNTLEIYVKHVKNQQGKSFSPIYPIVVEMLQKGLQRVY